MNEILQPERAARLAQATSDLASSDQITASPPIRPGTPEILMLSAGMGSRTIC
jgi:hypothetical protein